MTKRRNYFLTLGSIVAIAFSYFTDPNGGALTLAFLQQLSMPIVAVWFAYLARHALFDYIDLEELFHKARDSAVGAGLVFIGVCIIVFGLLGLFGTAAKAQDVNTYIPAKAHIYVPIVVKEQTRLWPDHPKVT